MQELWVRVPILLMMCGCLSSVVLSCVGRGLEKGRSLVQEVVLNIEEYIVTSELLLSWRTPEGLICDSRRRFIWKWCSNKQCVGLWTPAWSAQFCFALAIRLGGKDDIWWTHSGGRQAMFVHQPLTRASNALPLIDVTYKGYKTLVSDSTIVTPLDRVTKSSHTYSS
jgi:hypothetical protein